VWLATYIFHDDAVAQQVDDVAALELRLDAEAPGCARTGSFTSLGANGGSPCW
jgi:hypothetical protein